jgi:subtilase family serine protease
MSTIQSQELQWRLGFPHAFMVNYVGLSGQLVMMWKNEISLDIPWILSRTPSTIRMFGS